MTDRQSREPSRGVRGRPREFDPKEALDHALRVFWRRGYEGASLGDLTSAMGVNRPSLYAAFGDKENLFRKTLDLYALMHAPLCARVQDAATARDASAILLYGIAEFLADKGKPLGCFFTQTLLACGRKAEALRQELNARRMSIFAHMNQRFERAKAEGDLPKNADPADLARFVTVVVFGMGVLTVCGVGRRDLFKVVDIALRALPVLGFAMIPEISERPGADLNFTCSQA